MPGQSPGVNFGSLIFDPDISGNTVTFTGRVSTSGAARGIYRAVWDGSSFGPLSVVADNTTLVPGTGSTFTDFPASQAIDGNRVVFRGTGGGVTAVYLAEGGEIRRVIGPGDEIDGLTVATGTTAVTMGPNAIDGDWITFNVNFTNGSRSLVSVQITPVPEPMLLLLALPLAFLRRR